MKKFKFKIRGHSYETVISKFENNIVEIEVNGTHYKVEIEREEKLSKTPTLVRARVAHKPQDALIKQAAAGSTVNAPLPGTIFLMKVKEGDSVQKGDILLVMEAMKMENNILAETDGVVKAVKVQVGDSVLQNDVLIELS